MDGRRKRRRLKCAVACHIKHRKILVCRFLQGRDEPGRLCCAGRLAVTKVECGHFDLVDCASLFLCVQDYSCFAGSTLLWSKQRNESTRSGTGGLRYDTGHAHRGRGGGLNSLKRTAEYWSHANDGIFTPRREQTSPSHQAGLPAPGRSRRTESLGRPAVASGPPQG